MRRSLQITMLIVAAVPLVLGTLNLISGATAFVTDDQVNANLDNMLRFYAVWFMGAFFLTVWCVRNLDIAGPVMLIMFSTMALGGVARLFSITQVGLPDPPMLVATAVEVGVLVFVPWHRAVLRQSQKEPAA
ncbi:MAG: DUF4345 domain-containing protein [Pseudomonadota bacterium]